jgi:soluble lytic murein transglycosylase
VNQIQWTIDRCEARENGYLFLAVMKEKLINKSILSSFAVFTPMLKFPPSKESISILKIATPAPFRNEVDKASDLSGVPSHLIYSLMMHESGFNKNAVSRSGAVGLTQLMPRTGRHVAVKLLGMKTPGRQKLMDPKINIAVGARYLKELLNFTSGNIPLAILGYNAGPYFIKSLCEKYPGEELDVILEELNYQKLGDYVKKIISMYSVYRSVHGGNAPFFEIPLFIPKTLSPFMKQQKVSYYIPDGEPDFLME